VSELSGWRFALPAFDVPEGGRWGLQLDPTGRSAMVGGSDVTRQSILLLLSTVPGERVMRPTYGCNLHELAFAANDGTTAGLAMHHVRRAVQQWVPHAEIVRVDAHPDPDDEAVLRIRLDYRHRPTDAHDTIEVGISLSGAAT
jgi:uncharacterized protein